MNGRLKFVVAVVLCTVVLLPGRASGAASAPGYCKPLNQAFLATTTVDPNRPHAYRRAYINASKLLRKAARSAPKHLAEPLRHVSERYHEVVEEGEALEVSDISALGPDLLEIGDAAEQQCGFAIAPPTNPTQARAG